MVADSRLDTRTVDIGTIVATDQPERLVIQGIGSCLGIFLFEAQKKIGAVAHVLLPSGDAERMKARPGKYVESAVAEMLAAIETLGGHPRRVCAKMAGGAHMFNFDSKDERIAIGERNVQAALRVLTAHRIELTAHDTGGKHGRTLIMNTATGTMEVRTIRGGVTLL